MPDPLPYKTPATPSAVPRSSLRIVGCGIGLGATLLVVAVAVWVLDGMLNRFEVTVVVVNQTTAPIRRVQFDLGGRTFTVDNVAPGATARRGVTLRGSGQLAYTLTPQAGPASAGIAYSYLDADCKGARIGLRVTPNGVETFDPQ